ncbi:MAG: cyclic nucleotide-binding domain-containing protein [Acidimicrobiia bacterium]|nr:cyclic nucleotide-binding domain-containing protein [Acidimicrobiia bacterium]
MKAIHDLLAEHPFFAELEPADLDLLAGCGANVHFRAGERILVEGEPADVFYVLRSGRVSLEIGVPGRAPLVIDTVGAGEILGVSWLVAPHRWAFDAIALGETSAVALDAACLRGKCDADPRLGYALMSRFARLLRDRLQSTRFQLLDVYGSDVAG